MAAGYHEGHRPIHRLRHRPVKETVAQPRGCGQGYESPRRCDKPLALTRPHPRGCGSVHSGSASNGIFLDVTRTKRSRRRKPAVKIANHLVHATNPLRSRGLDRTLAGAALFAPSLGARVDAHPSDLLTNGTRLPAAQNQRHTPVETPKPLTARSILQADKGFCAGCAGI